MPIYSLAKVGVQLPDPPYVAALFHRDRDTLRLEEIRFQTSGDAKPISCPFPPKDWTRKNVGLRACAVAVLQSAARFEAAKGGGGSDVLQVASASSRANWLATLLSFYEQGQKARRRGETHPAARLLDLRSASADAEKRSGVAELLHVERHPREDEPRRLTLQLESLGGGVPRISIYISSDDREPLPEADGARLGEWAAGLVADTPRWTTEVRLGHAAKSRVAAPVTKLSDWIKDLEADPAWRRVLALQAQQLHGEAAKLADRELSAPRNSRRPERRGLWAGKAAAAYRAQGRLRRAAERGEQALREVDQAQRECILTAGEARFLKSKATFGLIIVREVMMKSDFASALGKQSALLVEADELLIQPLPPTLRLFLEEHHANILRQRHECRRYLGHYEEACASAAALERKYASGSAAQTFCRIHQADNLRLLGRFAEAREILESLLRRSREFTGDGAHASLLWRLATMQLAEGSSDASETLAELSRFTATDERQNRWLSVYGELVLASAAMSSAKECARRLGQARKCGHSTATYRPLEFAYAELIRGELARTRRQLQDGLSAFRGALALFKKMQMPWGRLRAAVGVRLCGGKATIASADAACSPLDKALSEAVQSRATIAFGALAWNLP